MEKLLKNPKIETILVTGGAGYVGSALVPKLLDLGYKVIVFDLMLYGSKEDIFPFCFAHKNLNVIKGDIRDYKLLERYIREANAVIHLACISNDPSFELNPSLGKSINYDASIKLFEISKKSSIKRFIYASSSSVYGVKKEAKVTEDLTLEPLTDYSKYKALCEPEIIKLASNDFVVTVVRPATVCGYAPRLRLDLTVNILTISALAKNKITVHGGSQERPNIHINDMCNSYIFLLSQQKNKINKKIYNVGFDNMKLIDIAKLIQSLLPNKVEIEVTKTSDLRSYRVSSEKIKKELGFSAVSTVKDAINDLKNAYNSGLIANPFSQDKYVNIKTMQSLNLK